MSRAFGNIGSRQLAELDRRYRETHPDPDPDLESENWSGKGESFAYAIPLGVPTPLEKFYEANPGFYRDHAIKMGLIKP